MCKPKAGESKQEFIPRCMFDSKMQKYEKKQRAAICYSKFENKEKSEEEIILKGLETWLKVLK
jgi:hypothetical protein